MGALVGAGLLAGFAGLVAGYGARVVADEDRAALLGALHVEAPLETPAAGARTRVAALQRGCTLLRAVAQQHLRIGWKTTTVREK